MMKKFQYIEDSGDTQAGSLLHSPRLVSYDPFHAFKSVCLTSSSVRSELITEVKERKHGEADKFKLSDGTAQLSGSPSKTVAPAKLAQTKRSMTELCLSLDRRYG